MIIGSNVTRAQARHRIRPRRSAASNVADAGGPTYEELYEEAKQRGIPGRSKMSKTELQRSLGR